MRYCGLYQESAAGGGGGDVGIVAASVAAGRTSGGTATTMRRRSEHEFNISDDEKRRKQFGKLIELPDDTTSNDTSSGEYLKLGLKTTTTHNALNKWGAMGEKWVVSQIIFKQSAS